MSEQQCLGYVDLAINGVVSGWILAEFETEQIHLLIDGVKIDTYVTFHARPDVMEQGIDGRGFEVRFMPPQHPYDLQIDLYESGDDQRICGYLSHSASRSRVTRIEPFLSDHAILTAGELNELSAALDPDTYIYNNFLSRFSNIRGVSAKRVDVLFIDGTFHSVSTRYRITHIAQGLQELGYTTRYASINLMSISDIAAVEARVVVFFRAPLTSDYQFILDVCRKAGRKIVYDMDDLIINPDLISTIDGIRYLSYEQVSEYHKGMGQYRKFASSADLVTCATPFLRDYVAQSLGVQAESIRNSLGRQYLRQYSSDNAHRIGDDFVIGYYSGSKTHQRDFAVMAPGLVRFLRQHSAVRLRLVGALDLEEFADFAPLANQIDIIPTMQYHEMLSDMGNCDVVVAPLEVGDPFCESKSELKFFEAALRGVPCIASPTRTYRSAMLDGELGRLPTNKDEWYEALNALYTSPTDRELLARRASEYVRDHYSYLNAAKEAERSYFGFMQPAYVAGDEPSPRKGAGERALDIAVIIPGVVVGGGGHRKILRFCSDWAKAGDRITLYVDTGESAEKTRHLIRTHFFDFNFELRIFRGFIDLHDVVICTHWSTAYALRDYRKPESVFYFIQDFEPMFTPVSTDYVKALATYQLGFHLVPFGRWVNDRVLTEIGGETLPVDFTVDLDRYKPIEGMRRSVDVLFFARPSQPRRCFELGIEALRLLYQSNNAIRIGLFGEAEYGQLGFPYHNFGLITELNELSRIYSKTNLGVCFSTTNPSSVGYEMIACGANLLDIKVPGWERNFEGDSFVYYALPVAEKIADVAARALDDPVDMDRRRTLGMTYVGAMPDDSHIGERLMEYIRSRLLV